MSEKEVSQLVGKGMTISVMFDTVTIAIDAGDDYNAQVLFDDITERLQTIGRITLAQVLPEKESA